MIADLELLTQNERPARGVRDLVIAFGVHDYRRPAGERIRMRTYMLV